MFWETFTVNAVKCGMLILLIKGANVSMVFLKQGFVSEVLNFKDSQKSQQFARISEIFITNTEKFRWAVNYLERDHE